MKSIILAAGKGSRLGVYTNNKPKCLLKLGEETILEREIRILSESGIKTADIYVVGGYKYELLEACAPNLIVNTEYEEKDNSYSLGIALDRVDDDVVILDADLCFDKKLIEELLNNPLKNVMMSKRSNDLEESTGIVVGEGQRIKAIGKQFTDTGYVYISIFKIGKDVIPDLKKALLGERSEKTWYTAAITELCDSHKFYNQVTEEKWHEIDFIEDYEETLQMFGLRETK